LDEIVASVRTSGAGDTEALFQRNYLRPIFLAVTIAMFNQLAGINACSTI
jgi:SP family arabinose:H+ symporter-like MFS transporter